VNQIATQKGKESSCLSRVQHFSYLNVTLHEDMFTN